VELQEEPHQGTTRFFRGQDIIPEALTPVFYLEKIQAFIPVGVQEVKYLIRRHVVPVLSDQSFHHVEGSLIVWCDIINQIIDEGDSLTLFLSLIIIEYFDPEGQSVEINDPENKEMKRICF
jgi:hypothetical protein